jgi:hypothetical protein
LQQQQQEQQEQQQQQQGSPAARQQRRLAQLTRARPCLGMADAGALQQQLVRAHTQL